MQSSFNSLLAQASQIKGAEAFSSASPAVTADAVASSINPSVAAVAAVAATAYYKLENAPVLKLGGTDLVRQSLSLPREAIEKLKNLGVEGSVSKKIRTSVETDIYLREQVRDGGQIFVRQQDGRLFELELPK